MSSMSLVRSVINWLFFSLIYRTTIACIFITPSRIVQVEFNSALELKQKAESQPLVSPVLCSIGIMFEYI